MLHKLRITKVSSLDGAVDHRVPSIPLTEAEVKVAKLNTMDPQLDETSRVNIIVNTYERARCPWTSRTVYCPETEALLSPGVIWSHPLSTVNLIRYVAIEASVMSLKDESVAVMGRHHPRDLVYASPQAHRAQSLGFSSECVDYEFASSE